MSVKKTVLIENVHIFDGTKFTGVQSLGLEDGKITTPGAEAGQTVDGQGGYLIPGLIDAHVHLTDHAQLHAFREHGQTTVLDMGCWPAEKMHSYRSQTGLPDIRSAGVAATTPESSHSKMPHWPLEELLESAEQAEKWVERRVAEGSDYIKVVCDDPGPSPDLVKELRRAANEQGKMAVAHAAGLAQFTLALDCNFDVITHLPIDAPLAENDARAMKEKGLISTPTLVMERAIAAIRGMNFENSLDSFKILHRAGVPILASSDANAVPMPSMPKHGPALLEEMEMMAALGMTELEVLNSATSMPAKYFRLNDRGSITNGMRADLVLLGNNPLHNISAIREIKRVWCNGEEWVRTAA